MHYRTSRLLTRLFVMAAGMVSCLPVAVGQDKPLSEMELIDRVAFLQHQLSSAKVTDRDAAEKELVQLGPMVLDHLEPSTDDTPTDVVQRLTRVRLELEKAAVLSVTQASKVSLQGMMTVGEALAKIREQTNNDVALPDETPDVFVDRKVNLEFKDVDFWVALADIMKQGDLIVDPYAGQPGQLRLTPTQEARVAAANPDLGDKDAAADEDKSKLPPRNVSGIFDLMVTKVSSSRNLVNPRLNYCNISVLVRWEPRVQPVSVDLPATTIQVVDEFDNKVSVPNPDAVLSGLVQPEIPELEFSIPIGLVDRQIEVIKSFEARIDAVLPGRVETFKFKKIGKLDPGEAQQKAGATVTFEGIRKNDDLYGVTVRLSFDEDNNALESHQGWAFNNPMHLLNEQGRKIEPIALETLKQDNAEIAIQYYFEDDPQELTLIYKTPAAIVKVPVKILLKDIPLP